MLAQVSLVSAVDAQVKGSASERMTRLSWPRNTFVTGTQLAHERVTVQDSQRQFAASHPLPVP